MAHPAESLAAAQAPVPGEELLIDARGVSKSFPDAWRRNHRAGGLWRALAGGRDSHAVPVLREVDLVVRRGESVGLIGENGAGKSTLLKILTRVLRPDRGQVRTQGRIGALLELGAGFHPDYTGRENIALSGALMGIPVGELKRMTPAILAFADIGGQIDEPIRHYSSGMIVRLGFAILSVTRPDLLITDEVLAVGDESFQRKCLRWIEDYLGNGGTLLLVTHSMEVVRSLCRRACWLKEGEVVLEGRAGEVVDAYLDYHGRRAAPGAQAEFDAALYRIVRMALNGSEETTIRLGEDEPLVVDFELHSPDDRPPVVAVGIRDRHATAVYGTTSEMDGAAPRHIAPQRYAFRITFEPPPLRPGVYRVNGHAMDPEGLRLFDTVIREFTLSGNAPGDAGNEGFLRFDGAARGAA